MNQAESEFINNYVIHLVMNYNRCSVYSDPIFFNY